MLRRQRWKRIGMKFFEKKTRQRQMVMKKITWMRRFYFLLLFYNFISLSKRLHCIEWRRLWFYGVFLRFLFLSIKNMQIASEICWIAREITFLFSVIRFGYSFFINFPITSHSKRNHHHKNAKKRCFISLYSSFNVSSENITGHIQKCKVHQWINFRMCRVIKIRFSMCFIRYKNVNIKRSYNSDGIYSLNPRTLTSRKEKNKTTRAVSKAFFIYFFQKQKKYGSI